MPGAGLKIAYTAMAEEILEEFATKTKTSVMSRYLAKRKEFIKSVTSRLDDVTINELGLKEFERRWEKIEERFAMIPGKDALAAINGALQSKFGISVTATAIIDGMEPTEISEEIRVLTKQIADFSTVKAKD